jgi:hypothetical protein
MSPICILILSSHVCLTVAEASFSEIIKNTLMYSEEWWTLIYGEDSTNNGGKIVCCFTIMLGIKWLKHEVKYLHLVQKS